MEESCSKKPFSFLQFTKTGSKSNFLEQNTFFRKIRYLRWQTSELPNITFSLSQTPNMLGHAVHNVGKSSLKVAAFDNGELWK